MFAVIHPGFKKRNGVELVFPDRKTAQRAMRACRREGCKVSYIVELIGCSGWPGGDALELRKPADAGKEKP